MTLIWPNNANMVLDAPRLHALVIGVADYPHLAHGRGRLAADPLNLSQVTTPHHTAAAVTRWLQTQYANRACPLGSVEALLSPASGVAIAPELASTERATFENVEAAFGRWFDRCNTHRENILFLYFCGHGLSKVTQFILPEDFGDPRFADRWRNCIDFDGMRNGLRSCRAQTQLFFVDACRETPFGMLAQMTVHGTPFITASIGDKVDCSSVYYAAGEGKTAHGPPQGISYFGQALLACFQGAGAMLKMGKWMVDTYSLSNALGQVVHKLGRRVGVHLTCNPVPDGLASIQESPGPRVYTDVKCSSVDADMASHIVIRVDTGAVESRPGERKPIIEEIPAGRWFVDVTFPEGEYNDHLGHLYDFIPPVFDGVPVP
jgi:hypothetical protein